MYIYVSKINNELTPSRNNNTKFKRYYIICFLAFKQTFLIREKCNNPYGNTFLM